MSTVNVKVVIFDQGNTLLMDPFQSVLTLQKNNFHKICQGYGIILNVQKIIEQWTRANTELNYPYISHFYQEIPIIRHALRNLGFNEEIESPLASKLISQYRTGLKEVILSDPRTREVQNTLDELTKRGKRLGVFSNDRIEGLDFVLNTMNIKSRFEYIETSESVGLEKPSQGVFEHIINSSKSQPNLIAYVGDDPIKDIEAAKSMGLKAIQYVISMDSLDNYNEPWRDYHQKSDYYPDAIIDRFSKLSEIIE